MAKKTPKKAVKKKEVKKKTSKYDEKIIIKGDLDSVLKASFKK